jgi:hypothetical protein
LKTYFNYAIKLGYFCETPFNGIGPIHVPESELPQFLDLDAIEKVREAFRGDQFEKLVEFYLLSGASLKEALELTWKMWILSGNI